MRPLRLTFLGTRGGIGIRSPRHHRHSSLLVQYAGTRIMIDCGLDWLHRVNMLLPTAIVLTHAHPDHASGLAQGAPRPRKPASAVDEPAILCVAETAAQRGYEIHSLVNAALCRVARCQQEHAFC